MATVEQGMNPHTELQQTGSINSTLNFMPSAVSSWDGAIWEAASSTTTTDHQGDHQERASNSINLMGRMAFTAQNLGDFNNIMEGNVNWMGVKYNNSENNNNSTIGAGSQDQLQYLNPLSPHESEAVSSSALQVPEEAAAAHDHHLLMSSHGFFKRHRDVHQLSPAADHDQHHDSTLHKKQRSSAFSTKETTGKEDPTTSNGSSEVGPALNTNGRPRAKRGSATDPQSVYARQRRERINERLKILQNLVPNGAKVDIVTMLEEAISYVKFLQLQVKLLSSDEYWMYAPTTYNGIDISFDMLQHSS